jgi:hypothetical protein
MHRLRLRHLVAVGIACLAIAGLAPSVGRAAIPDSVRTPIHRADIWLERAERRIANQRYARALEALTALRRNVRRAHRAANAQIGAPPIDPESDDLPGPPSVLAVLKLDRRVTVRVAALFNGMTREDVVSSLDTTLQVTHTKRDGTLDQVIALDPEGDGADYADGMADFVPAFTKEVDRLQEDLNTFDLIASADNALTSALARSQATRDKAEAAFGGGE